MIGARPAARLGATVYTGSRRTSTKELPLATLALLTASLALAHGGNGDWDEYILLLLAPLVVGAVLWVTRGKNDAGSDDGEP